MLVLICTACGANTNTKPFGRRPAVERAIKGNPDGTTWLVTKKMCENKSVELDGAEEFVFRSGFFGHVSNSPQEGCRQVVTYFRNIEKFSVDTTKYHERSLIRSSQLRTVCRNSRGDVLSDKTIGIPEVGRGLVYSNTETVMSATIESADSCSGAALAFELIKK